jgi:hypothetical protein
MIKIATLISFTLIQLASTLVQADDNKINEHKTKISAHIDKRIALLNEFKTCVNAASKKGDIQTCRKNHKEKMANLKEDHQD